MKCSPRQKPQPGGDELGNIKSIHDLLCGNTDLLALWLPQRGCDLRPRVAASATLGTATSNSPQPQGGCVAHEESENRRNRVAVGGSSFSFLSQGSRSGNPGL